MNNPADATPESNNYPLGNVFGKKIHISSQQMPRIFRHIQIDEEGESGINT